MKVFVLLLVAFAAVAQDTPGLVYPVLIYKVEPKYPPGKDRQRIEGDVLLSVDVGIDGNTHNIHVIGHLAEDFDDQARIAVKQWRFKPATKDGEPVVHPAKVSVSFRRMK